MSLRVAFAPDLTPISLALPDRTTIQLPPSAPGVEPLEETWPIKTRTADFLRFRLRVAELVTDKILDMVDEVDDEADINRSI